jgi:filamentous hemagglutinin
LIAASTITIQGPNLTNLGTISSTNGTQIFTSGDISNSGTISSGGNLGMQAGGNIVNGGAITSTGATTLIAAGNITDNAGIISAGTDLGLQAGGAITVNSTLNRTGIGYSYQVQQGSLTAGGDLTAIAQGAITLNAADLQSGGNLALSGASITANDAKNTTSYQVVDKTSRTSVYGEQVVGTNISAGGNATLQATSGDVTLKAANVNAVGALNVAAAGNVAITAGTQETKTSYQSSTTKSGFLSSTTTTTTQNSDTQDAVGSTLSGNTVNIAAGKNLTVTGSNVVGTGDVALIAGGDLTVNSAQSTSASSGSSSTTTSGLMGASSGIGFSIGTANQSSSYTDNSVTQVGSNVGSLTGNLTLLSGGAANVIGSTLSAANGNLSVTGATVNIGAAYNTDQNTQSQSSSFTGFTASIGSNVINAGEQGVSALQQAGTVQNGRLAALLGIEAGQSISTAVTDAGKGGGILNGGQVSLSIGSSSESSSATTNTTTAVGSTLTGKNIAVTSTQGDLDITGSSLSGTNISLDAAKNLNLSAAQNTTATQTTSSASSTSFGVSLAVGQQASAPSSNPSANMGLPTFSLSTSSSNSSSSANATQQVNTVVNASGNLSVNAGGNATLNGAQIYGNTVTGNIAGNLNLTSLQDTSTYNSNSSSQSAGLSVTGTTVGGSFSTNNGKANSTYASVNNQTGIYAGSGGFNINVGGNTNLSGAVIASTANPALNSLSTNTLTYGNIQNSAAYSVSDSGFSASLSGAGLPFMPSGLSSISTSGSGTSTTLSAIAPGTVTVRSTGVNGANNIAGLSRDTSAASNALAPIFNATDASQTLQAGQLFGQLATEAVGQIADQLEKTNILGQPTVGAWAEGGADRTALHAIVGAVTAALVGGNPLAGAAGSAAGEEADALVQDAITKATANLPTAEATLVSNLALNIIAGAAGSAVGSAVGGSGGASIGGSTALTGDLYNRQLNSAEKARIKGMIAAANAAGDTGAATRYADEACFKDQCYAQIPQSDTDAYQSALKMYSAGAQLAAANSPQYHGVDPV